MRVFRVLAAGVALAALLSGCGYHADRVNDYDKDYLVETYHGDLDSNLSIFPNEVPEQAAYHARLTTNLFDVDAEIILDCVYGGEQFDSEVARLSDLSMVIAHDDEAYTNPVLYDEEAYRFPAYITIDGFGNTYEYALINQEKYEIVYIYLSYPNVRCFQYKDYLKKDLSLYAEENTVDAYSMYNRSFDGGKSWVEFDD